MRRQARALGPYDRSVSRRADPERIYTARRAAHLSRLSGSGMPEDRAEAWCAAREAEAARIGREGHELMFWRDGGRWIDAQRETRRGP